jgi:hypothetical protein
MGILVLSPTACDDRKERRGKGDERDVARSRGLEVERPHTAQKKHGTHLEPGEVDAGLELGRRLEDIIQSPSIAQIHLAELEALAALFGRQSHDGGDAVQALLARVDQVVDRDHAVALLEEDHDRVRTNVPASARYQDPAGIRRIGRGAVAVSHGQQLVLDRR